MKWASPFALKRAGILGMNRRNVAYIGQYNKRSLYPLVDNKLKTKLLAEKYQVTVPRLLGTVVQQHEIEHVAELVTNYASFAIKPAKGSGGKGILVITGRQGDDYVKASGSVITQEDVKRHMTNILAGLYSLGGKPDVVIIEELIEFDDRFDGFSFQGVPDIRIIIFQGYPVMAMLRCATRASDGKANLHQGAVGVGLDIATGRCLNAVQFGEVVSHHPDTNRALNEIKIPYWTEMLELAATCYDMTDLGYIGTDLVLDKNKGPLLLELNARPGLSIQVANGCGLLPRLRHIEKLKRRHSSAKERVLYAMDAFGLPDELPPVGQTGS
ncbi:alpha-L-glutamate ligase-like protein [Gallaecimonas xiamenensis]|uniref:Alpha-L-glutamate ligase-like protein n=1 Tax=Gallaecimonas xiamenensis 3-C-1 TaxID=745411 RepID=K2J314_9GAMM|nr:alpha-L-glutamate ligase-like protein [Gallaecimonas xiamenensis]EKE69232.1 alpha-L-glutamate ligase-like protein [Gallaecimonas xiamenensis 3-C-1]